jgi:flagellar FliJ protein
MESKTLAMLIARAGAARDGASGRLARQRKLVDRARASLTQLQRYADDYARRASDQRGRGLDIAAELNQRAFDGRLQQAIRSQAEELDLCTRTADEIQAELARHERSLRSLEKLVARQAAVQLKADGRREQKFNDDLASRARAAFVDTQGH